jgi:hypothetical protein
MNGVECDSRTYVGVGVGVCVAHVCVVRQCDGDLKRGVVVVVTSVKL